MSKHELQEFDDINSRLLASSAANDSMEKLEREMGESIPPEARQLFLSGIEEAVALASEMAFREGRVIGELSKTDPRRALELMGGVDGAKEKLGQIEFKALMAEVRRQNGEAT